LLEFAHQLKTDLKISGIDYTVEKDGDNWQLLLDHELAAQYPEPSLKGEHQIQNAAGVIALLAHICNDVPVQKTSVLSGLLNTSLKGRLQQVAVSPDIYLDVAHNQQSAAVLANFIKSKGCVGDVHAVFSILEDKDLSKVTEPFIKFVKHWHIAQLKTSRSQEIDCLKTFFSKHSKYELSQYESIGRAFTQVRAAAKKEDLVICFGSFYVVEACLEAL
jgi:dihydrofolate synthase/folylpolyglutamate synthase